MRMKLGAALLGALFFASACSHQAQIPVVDGAALAQQIGAKQPGRYAVVLQTGGWALTAENQAFACSLNSFNVDVNPIWEKTAKEAVAGAVRRADFVTSLKSAEELKEQGYDAIVILTQSHARSEMAILPKLIRSEAISETALDLVMVVNWPDGSTIQEALTGQGRMTKYVFGCDEAADVVGQSASRAIRELAKQMIVTLKLHLAQRKG